jgi:hypothetical protein
MALEGTIVNGTVVFDESPSLPEGTRVEVVIKPSPEGAKTTLGQRLLWLAGAVPDLPADFAEEHNHYLHGTPRRQPKEEP